MSDFQRIAERYIQLWNEREPTRRQRLLEDNWLTGATYSDPMAQVAGQADINGLIGRSRRDFRSFASG